MDFSEVTFYPEFIQDAVIYACLFVLVIIVSRWLWNIKESRRLRKVWKEYQTKLEDSEKEA